MPREFNFPATPRPPEADLKKTKDWFSSQPTELQRNLIVEVGSGAGMHAIQLALNNPKSCVLAIERTSEKFDKLLGRAKSHKLNNLLTLHAEATVFLPHWLNELKTVDPMNEKIPRRENLSFVSQYYFMYPNPYPKASQKNLRWGNSPFMHFVRQSLHSDGRIVFATNIETYKDELIKNLPSYGLKKNECVLIKKNSKPRTHFEKKYLLRDESCWNLNFIKIEQA